MISEVYMATQGLISRQYELDLLAQNLANVNTSGYRGTNPFFYAYDSALNTNYKNPLNNMVNNQPVLSGQFLNQLQGNLKQTEGPLDLALEGKGFFKLETPFGTRYTRRGHFQKNADGALTTEQGYFVLDSRNQHIILDQQPVVIGKDGMVFQQDQARAQLAIVDLPNPENLVPEEDVLIASTDPNQQEQPASATVAQGYLESSNVDIAKQMIQMIEAQRAYEMNTKVIRTLNTDILGRMIQTYAQSA